jgi:hypothetical protein
MDATTAIVLPVLVAVVQALKAVPTLRERTWLLPFASMALGVAAVYVAAGFPDDPGLAWTGVVLGLAASGLYDAGRGSLSAAVQSRVPRL